MILIVEDDNAWATALSELLERSGYNAAIAHSAEMALNMMKVSHYDLVILDMVMDGMGGMGFLKAYERIDPTARVIVLTAYPSLDTAVPALSGVDAPAVAYLEKPVSNDELLGHVRSLVSQLTIDEFSVDLRTKTVWYNGESVKMTGRAYDLFATFMLHPDRWFTYEDLGRLVDGEEMDTPTATDRFKSQISRLRKQLRQLAGREVLVSKGQRYGFSLLRKKE